MGRSVNVDNHPLEREYTLAEWEVVEKWDAEAESLDVLNEPYPNEHAARLKNPGKYIRFRRQNNKFGRGIHAIWGVTKAQKTELQSIRFTASIWTVKAAKKWLKDHGYKPIRFEPATGKKGGKEMSKSDTGTMDHVMRMAEYMRMLEAMAARVYESEGRPIPQNMIVEVFQPEREHFTWDRVEADDGEPGDFLRIKAMVQRADAPNKNRRIYPYEILKRETEKLNGVAERGKSMTLLDHPPVGLFMMVGERLYDGIGRLTRTWMDGKEVWGEFLVEIQDNAKGRHLFSLIRTGFIPGISSRGTGSTRSEDRDGTTFDIICDDYRLDAYDFVSKESVTGAEIKSFRKEQTGDHEEEFAMEKDEAQKVVEEGISAAVAPVLEGIETLRSEDYVPKAAHEKALTEKDVEIAARDEKVTALEAEVEERDTAVKAAEAKIVELTPPETLKDEELAEKVEKDEPHRDEVLKALSMQSITAETFDAKLEVARSFVTELLTSEKQGKEHGELHERKPVDKTETPPETTAGETLFRKRGREASEDLAGPTKEKE